MATQQQLWKIECAPECGFLVRSHDRNETVNVVRTHAKEAHQKDLPSSDALGLVKPA